MSPKPPKGPQEGLALLEDLDQLPKNVVVFPGVDPQDVIDALILPKGLQAISDSFSAITDPTVLYISDENIFTSETRYVGLGVSGDTGRMQCVKCSAGSDGSFMVYTDMGETQLNLSKVATAQLFEISLIKRLSLLENLPTKKQVEDIIEESGGVKQFAKQYFGGAFPGFYNGTNILDALDSIAIWVREGEKSYVLKIYKDGANYLQPIDENNNKMMASVLLFPNPSSSPQE